MLHHRSQQQFELARQSLAGGVASSTRVNKALGHPLYFERAAGCRLWDLDGREYLDLCCSHGATLLGHGDERIRRAIEKSLDNGAPCSYENADHAALAATLCEVVPCLEKVRYTCSGSEATMHCLRLARAFTGKTKILKLEGNFHGYHDQVMFSINTPADKLGAETSPTAFPASQGMPAALADQLVLVPYNNVELLAAALAKHAHELAAVICEPIYYNAGCIIPTAEFATALRELTTKHGVLLIFDEVLSAFRMGPGGAQEYLKITPDLCTLGKAVGGGYPLSAFGGRTDIMARLMPQGDCQHSGTYNGHPLVVAAALAAVRAYLEPGFYEHIRLVGEQLFSGLNQLFEKHHVPAHVRGLGARFGVYFAQPGIHDYRGALTHDRTKMLKFIAVAIAEGVYFHDYGGAACHHGFCAATTRADVAEILSRLERALVQMQNGE
ncbi:aspartate aminotransferase family protein [Anatilimnocola floriformis]|uniref:aspartate aminotransferase family protein n=1 Tax=Anatilimnocola floriformis TaxID=2948575 RepID=UPI0020C1DC79|nr:aspartate aminotransferase family protein [Anatilimnocola floriformis]